MSKAILHVHAGVWILWSKKKIIIIFQKEKENTFKYTFNNFYSLWAQKLTRNLCYTTVCVIHGYLKVCMQFGLHTIILFSTSSHLLWAVFGMMFVVSLWRIATTFPEYRLICSELWCKTGRRISSFFCSKADHGAKLALSDFQIDVCCLSLEDCHYVSWIQTHMLRTIAKNRS